LRLEVRKTETIEVSKDADAIGNRVRVKVVKNKVAPPFRKTEIELMFGKGISATGSILDCAVKYDIIKKSGAWYSYNDEKIGQGRENCRDYLDQHPDFLKELEAKLRAQIFPGREFPKPAAQAKSGLPKGETPKSAPADLGESVAESKPVYETAEPSKHGRPKKAGGEEDALY
jgi:recombination protein RecA